MSWLIEVLLSVVSFVFIAGGSLFAVIGGIGVLRLPDFFSRLHGGGVTDTLGAGLLMVGLMVHAVKVGLLRAIENPGVMDYGPWLIAIKLAMILFFLLITSPTGCHALAQAALSHGQQPAVGENRESS